MKLLNKYLIWESLVERNGAIWTTIIFAHYTVVYSTLQTITPFQRCQHLLSPANIRRWTGGLVFVIFWSLGLFSFLGAGNNSGSSNGGGGNSNGTSKISFFSRRSATNIGCCPFGSLDITTPRCWYTSLMSLVDCFRSESDFDTESLFLTRSWVGHTLSASCWPAL